MSKVAVCGAGGVLGAWLLPELLKKGQQVMGIDNRPSEEWVLVPKGVEIAILDLSIYDNWCPSGKHE